MFKHKFKIQKRAEFIDGVKEIEEVIITEYSTNGQQELASFKVRVVDLPEVIELLKGAI